jgi:hypothetical protein
VYEPGKHMLHPFAPPAEYLPAAQIGQVACPFDTPAVPTGQLVQLEDPPGEYVPMGQTSHAVCAEAGYRPMGQGTVTRKLKPVTVILPSE